MQEINPSDLDKDIIQELISVRMPFGKYKGTILSEIPVYYIEWMYAKGMPKGRLGMQLNTLYIIKTNGLSFLLNHIEPKSNEL